MFSKCKLSHLDWWCCLGLLHSCWFFSTYYINCWERDIEISNIVHFSKSLFYSNSFYSYVTRYIDVRIVSAPDELNFYYYNVFFSLKSTLFCFNIATPAFFRLVVYHLSNACLFKLFMSLYLNAFLCSFCCGLKCVLKHVCWSFNHQYLWVRPYLELGSLQMLSNWDEVILD